MANREQVEEFRDANPDLAPLPQLALDEGEKSPVWMHVEKLMAVYARPEMTEREYTRRSIRWTEDTAALGDPALMAERLKGQLQGYEMSLYRFSQFNFDRAIEITRGELASLEMSIEYATQRSSEQAAKTYEDVLAAIQAAPGHTRSPEERTSP